MPLKIFPSRRFSQRTRLAANRSPTFERLHERTVFAVDSFDDLLAVEAEGEAVTSELGLTFQGSVSGNIQSFTSANISKVYFIGNSLTFDTDPLHSYARRLAADDQTYYTAPGEPVSKFQISGGKTLNWHFQHPLNDGVTPGVNDNPDLVAPWGTELASTSFDILSFQPHPGPDGTRANDIAAISHWMNMPLQKQAKIIIHAAWPEAEKLREQYLRAPNGDTNTTIASVEYADSLVQDLRNLFPDRTIIRTRSVELLRSIQQDIDAGIAPFSSIQNMYRDAIHMNNDEGYYVMSNLMRATLGLSINPDYNSPWLNRVGTLTATEREYLNAKIRRIAETFPKEHIWASPEIRNVALEGAASQSSTVLDANASRAIDGNIDGRFLNNSVTHTDNLDDSWWQVRLDDPTYMSSIQIYNRTDTPTRLSNFMVSVWDREPSLGGTKLWSQNYYTTNGHVDSIAPLTIYPYSLSLNGKRLDSIHNGRVVRIQLNGRNLDFGGSLSIAEVKVMGSTVAPTRTFAPKTATPVAKADTFQVPANWSLHAHDHNGQRTSKASDNGLLVNDTIAANSFTSAVLVQPPTRGTLRLAMDGTFSYIPHQGQVPGAEDRFTYRLRDIYGQESEPVTVSLQLTSSVASPYQNRNAVTDVNNDTKVSPIDALIVINVLKRLGTRVDLRESNLDTTHFTDVNGDSVLSPLDVLIVINRIRLDQAANSLEGEATIESGMAIPPFAIDAAFSDQSTFSDLVVDPRRRR